MSARHHTSRRWRLFVVNAGVLATLAVSSVAHGQTLTTLLPFYGFNGAVPYGSLTLSGSTLYGMTTYGGDMSLNGGYGDGTIFSVPATGGNPTTLFTFDGTNGAQPYGSLTLSGSTLYGMTADGGANGDGTIFSIPVTGGTPTVLFSFDGAHGKTPNGSLTLSGSTLYGMAQYGGPNDLGVVFSIPVTGGTPTILASFNGMDSGGPTGSLTLSGSTLYGATSAYSLISGGRAVFGTIFSVPVTGGTPTTLCSFDGAPDGAYPVGGLTVGGSTLYGMTQYGGADYDGTVFSVPLTGGSPSILFSFDGPHGAYPNGGLTLGPDGSTLYGMTNEGGDTSLFSGAGEGTIFSIPVTGGTPTILAALNPGTGAFPYGNLTLNGSTLYGMTSLYGSTPPGANPHGNGTVFALTLPNPGDANGDGTVDINDLTIVLANFNQAGCSWSQGCMDGDPAGTVDVNDLTIVLANFGTTYGASSGIKAVPEPATVTLLLASAAGLLGYAWRRLDKHLHAG